MNSYSIAAAPPRNRRQCNVRKRIAILLAKICSPGGDTQGKPPAGIWRRVQESNLLDLSVSSR
jgi:hypothetical protein